MHAYTPHFIWLYEMSFEFVTFAFENRCSNFDNTSNWIFYNTFTYSVVFSCHLLTRFCIPPFFFFFYFGSYYIHSVCNENTRLFFTHPPGGNFIDFEFYFRKTNFLVDFIHCKMLNLVYIYECNFHMKLNIETVFNSSCYNLNQFQRAPSIRINASHSKFESHWYWNLKLDCVKVQYQHHSISNDSNHFELISIEFDSIFFFYTNQTQWAFYWFKQVYFFFAL